MRMKPEDLPPGPKGWLVAAKCNECGFHEVARPSVQRCGECHSWTAVSANGGDE